MCIVYIINALWLLCMCMYSVSNCILFIKVKFDRRIENLLVTLQQTLTEKKRVRKYSISQLTEGES